MMHDIVGELSVRGRNFQPNVTLKKKKKKKENPLPTHQPEKGLNASTCSSQLAVLPTSRKGGAALISAVKRSCEALLPLGFCVNLFQFSFCVCDGYMAWKTREDLND